jgi:hypothetical protein
VNCFRKECERLLGENGREKKEEKVMIKNPVEGISSHHYHVIQDEISTFSYFFFLFSIFISFLFLLKVLSHTNYFDFISSQSRRRKTEMPMRIKIQIELENQSSSTRLNEIELFFLSSIRLRFLLKGSEAQK